MQFYHDNMVSFQSTGPIYFICRGCCMGEWCWSGGGGGGGGGGGVLKL